MLWLLGPLDDGDGFHRVLMARGHEARFSALAKGTYRVWTRSPRGLGVSVISLEPGENHFTLEQESGASARLVYSGEAPLARHEVVLVTDDGVRLPLTFGLAAGAGAMHGVEAVAGEREPADGSLTFAVPPGQYSLEVSVDGSYRRSRPVSLDSSARVEMDSGKQLPPVTLFVTRRGQPLAPSTYRTRWAPTRC